MTPALKTPAAEAAAAGAGTRPATPALLQTLRAEHRYMGEIIRLFREQLDAIAAGELVDPHVVYEVMEYMISWPDRFHHPREDLIYARAAELSGEAADEVDTLQRDHDHTAERGRALLDLIIQWRRGGVDGDQLVQEGRAYTEHIFEHMRTEEQLVFPHVESLLTTADWYDLAEDDHLQPVSEPVFGYKIEREFRNMTRKLRRSMRRRITQGVLLEWVSLEAVLETADVIAMASESGARAGGKHLRNALSDAGGILLESPLTAPWKIAANNTRIGLRLAGDLFALSMETLDDLQRVNQERKDRVRLLSENR
ncbi:MAG: hemerythrin domain-containing protein [Pseudomonadota bacterium]